MHLLYIMDKMSCRGGMERIITDKINYLAANTAHEVTLMTVWHDPLPPAYPFHSRVRHVRLNVPLPPVPGGYMLTLPWALRRFDRQVKRLQPDIAVVFRAVGSFLTALTSWKGKIVYESHQPRSTMNHRWIYSFMERRADAVVCLTKGDAREFGKARRVEVIPNFTDIRPDAPASLDARRCIAVGRLCKEKDFMRLLDIWKTVAESHPGWRLDIFGEGEERRALEERIVQLRLGDTVTLKGTTDNIVKEYLDSSMLLVTSRTEGFSMAIAEAMACGLPVVSLDCPYGPREIMGAVADGFTVGRLCGYAVERTDDKETLDRFSCAPGYLLPLSIPEDDRSATAMTAADRLMAACISALIDSPALRREKGRAALQRAASFRPAPIMAQWLKLFRGL